MVLFGQLMAIQSWSACPPGPVRSMSISKHASSCSGFVIHAPQNGDSMFPVVAVRVNNKVMFVIRDPKDLQELNPMIVSNMVFRSLIASLKLSLLVIEDDGDAGVWAAES